MVVSRTGAIATGYGVVNGENCRLVEPGDAAAFEVRCELVRPACGSPMRLERCRSTTFHSSSASHGLAFLTLRVDLDHEPRCARRLRGVPEHVSHRETGCDAACSAVSIRLDGRLEPSCPSFGQQGLGLLDCSHVVDVHA